MPKIYTMLESIFLSSIEFVEIYSGWWVANYRQWSGSGKTKAEAFDDLIDEILRDARIGAAC